MATKKKPERARARKSAPKPQKRHGLGAACWCQPRRVIVDGREQYLHNDAGPVVFEGSRSDEEVYREMGSRLRARREARGLSLAETARMLGKRPTTLQYMEINGARTVADLARLLNILDWSYDEAFGDLVFSG